MKISIDTKEDSHEEIRKAIKMLQHIVGDSQEIFTNQPPVPETGSNPFTNIFGDSSSASDASSSENTPVLPANTAAADLPSAPADASEPSNPASESTEGLFAELFSEEELQKMEPVKEPEDEDWEEEAAKNPKKKKYGIEFY